jgi:C4-dicarboxylate-binding protein DctP|tara:strand:- start:1347 stop:2339 length:993 start_codon:yes stop_codon:yes gene_type:complete
LKRISGAAVGLLLMSIITSPAQSAEVMRCSHQLPPDNHIAKVIDQWAAEIETLTENGIDVQVNGAGSLVQAPRNAAAVKAGEIECAFSMNSEWTKDLPLMDVTLEPFALRNVEILKKWDESSAARLLEEKIQETGLTNVAWLFTTWRTAITSKGKYLVKPEDFEGIRIQGLGPISNASFAAMGATAIDMSDMEAVEALMEGELDAGLTNISSALSARYFNVQNHVTILPLLTIFYNGYLNSEWYNSLSEATRQAIQDASDKAVLWAIEASEISAAAAPRILEEEGMRVHIATPEEVEALKSVMRPAFTKAFLGATGSEGAELIELVENIM